MRRETSPGCNHSGSSRDHVVAKTPCERRMPHSSRTATVEVQTFRAPVSRACRRRRVTADSCSSTGRSSDRDEDHSAAASSPPVNHRPRRFDDELLPRSGPVSSTDGGSTAICCANRGAASNSRSERGARATQRLRGQLNSRRARFALVYSTPTRHTTGSGSMPRSTAELERPCAQGSSRLSINPRSAIFV